MRHKRLRVGVIGVGIMGARHVAIYSQLPQVELCGIADPNEQRLHDIAAEFNVPHSYPDYRDLLRNDEIQAVSICTPDHLHRAPAEEAAAAGKDILLEKPIATTLEDADAIIEAASRHRVKLMVGFTARFMKPFDLVKEKIDSGAIGEVLCARVDWYNRSDSYARTESEKKTYGPKRDSIIHFLGSHPIDLLQWYLGDVDRVYCEADTFTWGRAQGGPFDSALISLRFRSGAIGHVNTYWSTGGTPFRVRFEVELLGRTGMIQCHPLDESYKVYSEQKGFELPVSYDWKTGVGKELGYFVDCIVHDTVPMISGQIARKTLEVTLAAERSARTQESVRLAVQE